MTTPNDPNQPPGYGQPPAQPPAPGYGTPAGYGSPAGYGAPPPVPQAAYGGAELAGWGTRVGAALIDGLIVVGIYVVALILGAILSNVANALGAFVLVLGWLGAIGFTLWNNYQLGVTGQSIGKQRLGIYVRKEVDGSFVGGGMGIARIFIHIIDGIPCYLGYLWPLWDAKKQTFTDKVMATVVVKG